MIVNKSFFTLHGKIVIISFKFTAPVAHPPRLELRAGQDAYRAKKGVLGEKIVFPFGAL